MGQRRALLLIAAMLTCWVIGSESVDLAVVKRYKLAHPLWGSGTMELYKYQKAMGCTFNKNNNWVIDGDTIVTVVVVVGKNKDSKWQINIIAEGASGHNHATQLIFEEGKPVHGAPLLCGKRNATQTFKIQRGFIISRKIKMDGFETTHIASFSGDGERMSVILMGRGYHPGLRFQKEPEELDESAFDV